MLEDGYKLAKTTVVKYKTKVDKLAKALLEYETLTGDEVRAIVKGKKISLRKKDNTIQKPLERKSSVPVTIKNTIKKDKNV